MGNFRSEAEVTKHNKVGKNGNIEFAVSHMCGKYLFDCRVEIVYGGCFHCTGSLRK